MKDKFFFDLGRVMDDIFDAAQDLGKAFKDGFACSSFDWDEKVDFYPSYSYPPANVYLNKNKELVFEFAMSGFNKEDIGLLFQGDYMTLSAKVNEDELKVKYEDVRFFKKRLKLKAIDGQKYYVPASRFDREKSKATFKNGLLTIVVPPSGEFTADEGINVEINEEDK